MWVKWSVTFTVTALQTLLVCRAYAGPHDVVYNTMKTVYMLVRPKQSQVRYSTRVRLGDEELHFVDNFCYLERVMTADCWDDKDIGKRFRRQNAYGHELVRKFSFGSTEAKILFKPYCYPIYGCALWRDSYVHNSLKNLLSVIATHSNNLLMFPNTPVRVWHLRWTPLTISMWCSANLLPSWWAE